MNNGYGRSGLNQIPPVIRGLLIINVLLFLLSAFLKQTGTMDLESRFGLFYFSSEFFRPYQLVTHLFMHHNLSHLFFNMYALWLFGQIIERKWGAERTFIYYFATGFGAMGLHSFVVFLQLQSLQNQMNPEQIHIIMNEGAKVFQEGMNYMDPLMGEYNLLLNIPVLGASGAVFGILLAFGMLFPNVELFLFFIPIPIKAKYLVFGYGLLELILGLYNAAGDNVAHFAHLGGMIFGFILIKIWQKKDKEKPDIFTYN